MGYDAKTERLIALKKLAGKAQTSNDKGLANEALPSGLTISSESVFGEPISTAPSAASLYDITGKVEYLRFQAIFIAGSDTSVGRHGFELKLPADYEANTSNPAAGTYPFLDNQSISITSGSLQLVPPSFATAYEAGPFYGGTSAKDSGTSIPLLDARDWYLDYFNGVLFQQDPPGTGDHSNNPDFAQGFLYIGEMLDVVVRNSGSGGGSGPGDADASYVVMSLTGSLNADRQLTAGTGLSLEDGGANASATFAIKNSIVATLTGSTFTGPVHFSGSVSDFTATGSVTFDSGLSGSLTQLPDGTSYLVAGSNVTITSASNGAVTVSSTGGGGGGSNVGWIGRSPGQIDTTGSLGVTGSLHALGSNIFGNSSTDFHQFTGSLHISSSQVGGPGLFRIDHEDSSEILFATGSGRVGIGTALPFGILDVKGDGSTSQVFFLSGSGAGTDPNESLYSDLAFFMSGSIGSRDTSTKGVALFGGDVVVSGSLSGLVGLSGSLTRLTDGTSFLVGGSGITITSGSSGQVTIASSFGTLARTKAIYEVTQSHPAEAELVIPSVDFSDGAYNPNLIDVFLNGQLLTSGTLSQVSAGNVDYTLIPTGSVKFGFTLEEDDTLVPIILNNS